MFRDYQPPVMGIRPQNMTQTSNSLLSSTNSTVAEGQPMVTKNKQWCTFDILRQSTTYSGYKTSKYDSNFKFPIITHLIYGC